MVAVIDKSKTITIKKETTIYRPRKGLELTVIFKIKYKKYRKKCWIKFLIFHAKESLVQQFLFFNFYTYPYKSVQFKLASITYYLIYLINLINFNYFQGKFTIDLRDVDHFSGLTPEQIFYFQFRASPKSRACRAAAWIPGTYLLLYFN